MGKLHSLVNLTWPDPIIPPPLKDDESIDYLPEILNAKVYQVAHETPISYCPKLSGRLDANIHLKREDLQPIFSFKCRGAYNKICSLTDEEKARGVCCVSAGNHAQGVALAASKLGINATIVMPTFAPDIKVENVRRLGGNVVLFGSDFDDAKKECLRLCKEKNFVLIPPFDDPKVIAGQGTVGGEILRQMPDQLDAIFVCCGGGGLIAGISAYVKRVRPNVRVIGVNTVDSDSMYQSLLAGQPVEIKQAGLFADGTSVRLVGKECVRLARKYVDDMVLVTNDEICAAIKDTFDDTRSILEPAGALALAGLKKYVGKNLGLKGGTFVAVTSGANMNFDRLRFVAERANIGENKEGLLSVLIPERPGTLQQLQEAVQPRQITELSYRYASNESAHVFLGFEIKARSEVQQVIDVLQAKGWEAIDITDNELAKAHGRYMVGGRTKTSGNEVLIRCRFPERPGSLSSFLKLIKKEWNIKFLIIDRCNGADFSRVLFGIQVPKEDCENGKCKQFQDSLASQGIMEVIEETDNPVYKHFLQ